MSNELLTLTTAEILAARGPKNRVDPWRPYAYFVEPEPTACGQVEDVATVLITNRECPFRCLMCDLWKNTTDQRVPAGAVIEQIRFALQHLPRTRHIKLYNSGNFFDAQAVRTDELPEIAKALRHCQTVVVENHPKLCREHLLSFGQQLDGQLEVALGLETVHPDVLPRLNKQMTLDDFARAVEFLLDHGVNVRAFILIKPPYVQEQEGIDWALRSLEYAYSLGVGCCSVIPTRAGNGAMDRLRDVGLFTPPRFSSVEAVMDEGMKRATGRLFVDLWDLGSLAACPDCGPRRVERLRQMNLQQRVLPSVQCAGESCA